ncbi:hypothetical protein N7532_002146 [Penicillium argentinense]|uniref:non-reducing end alpha-L-arabinofuranosidase n=1 Tax=Penicillium argentinense TaxID=1131581 RepID=A0A9W9G3S6_9EURO|nr:uncharacterized protein N7532_002146 [Penicillium argentinense]KAJ5111611.1 hypothetical protein N7532_002146 [Penicillium argentinense]
MALLQLASRPGVGILLLCFAFFQAAQGISLQVQSDGGNASSPILYGFMFEDINHSGDGGIYGQLLQNNGLQGKNPDLTSWGSIGDATIAVDSNNPLTSAIPHSLRLDVSEGATGTVGVTNNGHWGIPVDGSSFQIYFWIKGDLNSNITARLVGNGTGTEYASTSIQISSNSNNFTYIDATFPTTIAPDGNVYFELDLDASEVAGSSLYFSLVQLFPETFKSRQNGLQPRLANALDAMNGSFLRFPGGNNLEGEDEGSRWKWNETVGPVEDRPGRQGTWGYYNTDGLGLAEYFYWCEDMGLDAVLGVWDGYALESGGNTPITGDALSPYIDEVLNELEYILGDSSTQYGAMRVAHGQKDPWPLKMVEIGNEDNLGGGCDTYGERFTAFYNEIHKTYPDLTIIASTAEPSCLPPNLPNGTWMDWHNYNTPDGLVGQFNMFDNKDRDVPYFIGEYAQNGVDWPVMKGSVGEAVFMIGLERNSDVVKMAAYAPLLQLTNSTQWKPNLIAFSQAPSHVVKTTSYYVQQMFSANRGATIKEVKSDSPFGPVYWVASTGNDAYYVKLANYGSTGQEVSISIPEKGNGKLTMIANDDPNAANTDSENPVSPVESDVTATQGNFTIKLPAWSVAVLVAN